MFHSFDGTAPKGNGMSIADAIMMIARLPVRGATSTYRVDAASCGEHKAAKLAEVNASMGGDEIVTASEIQD